MITEAITTSFHCEGDGVMGLEWVPLIGTTLEPGSSGPNKRTVPLSDFFPH